MKESFKKNLLNAFKLIIDELPENFDSLINEIGMLDIDLEIYSVNQEHTENCCEKFSCEFIQMEDNELVLETCFRTREFVKNDEIIEQDLEFDQIYDPPFKIKEDKS